VAEESKLAVLQKRVVYDGEEYTRDSLQQSLKPDLERHSARIEELESLKNTHDSIAREMSESLAENKSVWDCVKEFATGDRHKMSSGLRGLMERIPLLRGRLAERPLSELLQDKIQLTETRIREVGSFLDRMESEVENTRQDIQRLNNKMLAAATNKEKAAGYILELREIETVLNQELKDMGPEVTAAFRQKQADIDQVRRLIWEHGAKLRLYANADERMSSIVKMNNNLMELLTNLHTNMMGLYDSGQEVLDELRGNLASLSTATEASELTMDMQKAMQSLKESVNKVAQLASSTSLYLTQNVEKLTSEMRVYDSDTEKLVESNLAAEREIQERRIDETLRLAQKEQHRALPGEPTKALGPGKTA
jgi:hypothetical protein